MLGLDFTANETSAESSGSDSLATRMAEALFNLESSENEKKDISSSHTNVTPAVSPPRSKIKETTGMSDTSFWGRPLPLGHSDQQNIWTWTSDDDRNAARIQASISAADKECWRKHDILGHIEQLPSGAFRQNALGLFPVLIVNSVDDAFRCVQEVRCFKDISPAINVITSWAAIAKPTELREFNKACEIYPYAMWVRPSFPQMDYSELQTILPYIKKDYRQDLRKSKCYIDLEAAHLLGMIWSKLYTRGVLTNETYYEGVRKLTWGDSYVLSDILDTILTTRLDELGPVPKEKDVRQFVIKYREIVRENKLRCLDRIHCMERWQ